MKVIKNAEQTSIHGGKETFSGHVRIDGLFQADAPAKVGGATVTFDVGARTAWHTHPLGQTLLVLSGTGWLQKRGEKKQIMQPGDIVWIAPNEEHWHGATDTSAMTHVAIAEAENGSPVTWLDLVTENDYLAN